MIKLISLICISLGALLIAAAVFIFFRTNGYAVYKDLKSTEKVQLDISVDSVAKSVYYENQMTESYEEEEEEPVSLRKKLRFRKRAPAIARDDTSILYEEQLREQSPAAPKFGLPKKKREEDMGRTDILDAPEPKKEEEYWSPGKRKTKNGTEILYDSIRKAKEKNAGTVSETAPLTEVSATAPLGMGGTEPLETAPPDGVRRQHRSTGTEPLHIEDILREANGETAPLMEEPYVPQRQTEPLQSGTEPLEEIRNQHATAPLTQ